MQGWPACRRTRIDVELYVHFLRCPRMRSNSKDQLAYSTRCPTFEPHPDTGLAMVPGFWRPPTDNDVPSAAPYSKRFGVDGVTRETFPSPGKNWRREERLGFDTNTFILHRKHSRHRACHGTWFLASSDRQRRTFCGALFEAIRSEQSHKREERLGFDTNTFILHRKHVE
jgi:hypothetical protein